MSHLELSLLGAFHVALDGSPVSDFGTDKTRALLAYVCVEGSRPHRRDALAGLLWPEQPEEAARRNLRQALYKLRQVLQEGSELAKEGSPDFLLVTTLDVQLDPDGDFQSDVGAFSSLIAACRAHRHRKAARCTTCHARLRQAAELYRGDFLEGFFLEDSQAFDEWLVLKREALRRQVLEAFSRLAIYYETRAEYEPALHYTYRQLELEPWSEGAYRQVMRLLAQTRQRNAALTQYEAYRQMLAKELNTEPDAETTALYERLRAGDAAGEAPAQYLPSVTRNNLPRQLTPFVGREEESARIIEQLDSPDYCLITLAGPGGVGKTRLALQAAKEQLGAFTDGVYWVPLLASQFISISSPELLVSSIAQAIGLHFEAATDPQTQLLNYLGDKEMLLVLDNFEHLLGVGGQGDRPPRGTSEPEFAKPRTDATDLLLSILKSAPRISMVVTSRERLGLQAEFLLDLSGLALPEVPGPPRSTAASRRDQQFLDPAELMSYSAVQLFVERAQQADSEFALSRDTAQGVVDICRLVDGLPLGIVLAAAWVRHFSPARIAGSIRANLDFLSSAARDASPQHGSLRAVFNHSWSLLSEEEMRVFRKLSVFYGGWEEEAAQTVAGASVHSLLSLVDKSLLRRNTSGRFDIHEVLRQYATEKLDELPEERDQVKHRHAEYYLQLAELAREELKGEEQDKWLERLEREHNNLRAALRWAQENVQVEIGLRLVGALSQFWFVRGYYSEGREVLASVLSLPTEPSQAEAQESLRLKTFRAKALQAAGDLSRAQGDYTTARPLCEESLALYRELEDGKDIAIALVRLAIVAWNQGDRTLARSLYEEGLAISRELGNKKDIAVALGNLGLMAFVEGDYITARSLLEESIALFRDLGDKFNLAIRLNNLGNVALMQEDYAGARLLHKEGLALRMELRDKWGIAVCLVGLGGVAVAAGNVERGASLLGAAEALLNAIGAFLEADDRIPYEQGIASARTQLGEQAFGRAWAQGRAMSLEQAIADALEG